MTTRALLLVVLITSCCGGLYAANCDAAASRYAELNRSIIVQPNASANAETYAGLKDSVTDQLHRLVDTEIVQELGSSPAFNPASVVSRIRCIQRLIPQYQNTADITNVPVAFILAATKPELVVAFEIYRGGIGAPDSLPFVEVFRYENGGWTNVASTGGEFEGSMFFVNRVNAGKTGEEWFLLWGRRIGQTGGRLRLELTSFNGTEFTTVSETRMVGASIAEAYPDHVVIAGESTNEHGRAEEFRDRYDIVSQGLKHVDHKIVKSY